MNVIFYVTKVSQVMIYLKINPEGVSRTQAGVLTPATGAGDTNPEGVKERLFSFCHPFGVCVV